MWCYRRKCSISISLQRRETDRDRQRERLRKLVLLGTKKGSPVYIRGYSYGLHESRGWNNLSILQRVIYYLDLRPWQSLLWIRVNHVCFCENLWKRRLWENECAWKNAGLLQWRFWSRKASMLLNASLNSLDVGPIAVTGIAGLRTGSGFIATTVH